MFLLARGAPSGAQLGQDIRRAVQLADPAQAIFDLRTMNDRIELALGPQHFTADLLIGFTGLALFLAATGLYSVISYSVARRTKEIGIRTALGAERSRILIMVAKQTTRLLVIGFVAGLLGACWFASLGAGQLFQVSSLDVPTLALTALILVLIALLATAVPAWRATHIDPVLALRNE